MNADFDAIVAGAGSMGAAASFYLAKAGYKVLAIDKSEHVPHENGSHGGQSRIIRKAYFEDPAYIPLLNRAYQNWKSLETETGEQVYYPCGLIYKGPVTHPLIQAVKEAAQTYHIDLQPVTDPNHLAVFNLESDDEIFLEPDAGFLLPEKCIRLFLQQALKQSARLHTGETLLQWQRAGELIRVETTKSVYHTRKLIITAGAWIGELIASLRPILKVTRQLIVWVQPDEPNHYLPHRFPCWLATGDQMAGAWYGFPYLSGEAFPGPAGMKLALHLPAQETSPDKLNRMISETEIRELLEEAKKYFIPAGFSMVEAKTCLYTSTPDEHFIMDHLPGFDGDVTIGSVCSGHGFKFASAAGEILAELAMEGQTSSPIEFLRLNRFAQH